MRWFLGILLLAHGWVHGVMWGMSYNTKAVADLPKGLIHSWLLGGSRTIAVSLAAASAAVLMVGGIVRLADAGWWPGLAIAGAVLSTVLLILYFSPWWAAGFLINAAIIALAWRELAAS